MVKLKELAKGKIDNDSTVDREYSFEEIFPDLYVKKTTTAESRGEMDGSFLEEISKRGVSSWVKDVICVNNASKPQTTCSCIIKCGVQWVMSSTLKEAMISWQWQNSLRHLKTLWIVTTIMSILWKTEILSERSEPDFNKLNNIEEADSEGEEDVTEFPEDQLVIFEEFRPLAVDDRVNEEGLKSQATLRFHINLIKL
ncbi:hypothetical protein HAX54_025731, partial [Datura stramonium]|nr:hypothetical protein [Datura stramonium]